MSGDPDSGVSERERGHFGLMRATPPTGGGIDEAVVDLASR